MSYHILHVFQHGALLGKERGFITCQGKEDAKPRTMPLDDLRAVIIAARGVMMSSNFISSVVEQDGITVLIDPKATLFILGTEMDYVEEKLQSGFVFRNPNEKGRCGCGESFHV